MNYTSARFNGNFIGTSIDISKVLRTVEENSETLELIRTWSEVGEHVMKSREYHSWYTKYEPH